MNKDRIPFEDMELSVAGEAKAKIPEGIYEVMFTSLEKSYFYTQQKLYVWFKIVDQDEFNDIALCRSYNLYIPIKRQSDLAKDCERILNRRLKRNERISFKNIFKGKVFKVRVRTVVKDLKQDKLPDFQQYSVIDKVLEVAIGGN